ncbi:branched-chain amino acid ABC transporter substrate-binding protein [Piscinibacter terrae]|uniref:Branched-chain amino acid ABC transporter substrate-binding protein n=1 Tax=Piscinibacter terrae TaxID=2496871 RepID=A0A3N7HIT6_9BURK|nr:branched-chain amino acid ABC transporter substrate-binding protein [Albitalea terrae]RQP21938.1 branched-chain amino acid ABC transporter substrate-binding protein [Albitalea terrae]
MTSRRVVLAAITVASSVLLGGCSRVPDTVKIGVAQPMSGPLAALGADMKNGVQLAVDELNTRGFKIDGKTVKLEVVSVDDRSNADTGKAVAKTLVDANVVAVIGHLNSGVSIAAAPVYAEAGIAQLAISTKPEYTQLNLPTTLRLVANDALQSKALGSYAATQIEGKRFAVVDDNTPYGKGLADLAAAEMKKNKKELVVRASLDDKTTDFSKLVPELKAGNVDVFVTTLADFQVAALIKQLVQAGMNEMQIVGGDTIKTDKLPQAVDGIKAVYSTSPIIEAREFVAGPQFLAKFREAFKGDPVYGAHYAYDAVYVLAAAMQRGGTADPKKVLEELKRIDALAPVTNNMRFKADGEQYYGVVSVYKARGGRWEPVTRSDSW